MSKNAVVAPHYHSAEAGRRLFQEGGNAVDAAVAVVAAQGVVAPETCGLGGDLFALIHQPGWEAPRTLNASGRAGSNVDAASMRDQGHTRIPLDHPLVATIPGCVDGLTTLSAELGSLPLARCLQPAIELATSGFEVSTEQARAFSYQADTYRDNPAVSSFYRFGNPVKRGDLVLRDDLGRTLVELADSDDRDSFYLGEPGDDIIEAVGGLITKEDLARDQAEWVTPLGVEALGLTGWTTPPNSQGYLGPAALAVFEMLDPPHDPEDPLWWHLLIEAYRCLSWERNDLVSDPNTPGMAHDKVLSRQRLADLADTVTDRAGLWPASVGTASGTAYMCVADSQGMMVSVIQSNFRGTGSPFGARRSGFLLQDRGLGFNLIPGHPNELGPGKRPLHTLSPTLWTDGDQPRWLIGTRGGDIQPQLVAQLAARVLGAGQDPEEAQRGPRWSIDDFGPGSGSSPAIEPGVPARLLDDLRGRGHMITGLDSLQSGWGPMSIIEVDGETRKAAADPRVDTTSALIF